jgi:hypothetical protein
MVKPMRKYLVATALFAATCCFVVGCGDGKKCCEPKPAPQMNAPKPEGCTPKRSCGNEKVDTKAGVVPAPAPIPPSRD